MFLRRREWQSFVWILAAFTQPGLPIAIDAVDAQEPEAEEIFFHDDYNKAIHEAKLTKKPIFLEFRCAP